MAKVFSSIMNFPLALCSFQVCFYTLLELIFCSGYLSFAGCFYAGSELVYKHGLLTHLSFPVFFLGYGVQG